MSDAQDPFETDDQKPALARPRLRDDLRIGGASKTGDDARFEITDPVTSKSFSFTEQEHFLCVQSDGSIDLATLHARYREKFGADLPPGQMTAFLRRLRILGLLATDAPAKRGLAQGPETRGSENGMGRAAAFRRRNAAANGDGPAPQSHTTALKLTLRQRVDTSTGTSVAANAQAETSTEAQHEKSQALKARAHDLTAAIRAEAAKPESPESTAVATPPEADQASAAQRRTRNDRLTSRMGVRQKKDGPRAQNLNQATKSDVAKAPAADSPTPQDEAPLPIAVETDQAPPVFEPTPTLPVRTPAVVQAAAVEPTPSVDPFDIIAANLGPADPPMANLTDEDLFDMGDDDLFSAAMGGGLGRDMNARGGFGGFGAGGGGGMGGAGLGGFGGARGGAAGGGAGLRAALAARQGMGGGMAMGARGMGMAGADMAAAPQQARPSSVTLFNPTWLLKALFVLFYPAKWFIWALIPLIVLSGLTILQNWRSLGVDLSGLAIDYSALTKLMVSMVTVNLISRLAQGVAIIAKGGTVTKFGIMLEFGITPRFFIDRTAISKLDRNGQLWAHGSPLLARLGLFVGGVLTWAILRDTGGWLPETALLVGQFGLVMFLITSIPSIPGDGQRWIATYFGEPKLMGKSFIALKHVMTGKPMPPFVQPGDITKYALFAVAMVISSVALIASIGVSLAIALETELGGTGVALFLGIVLSFILWLIAIRASIGRRTARLGGLGAAGLAMGAVDTAPEAVVQAEPENTTANSARVVWALVAFVLLAIAFLPYDYEAGGTVEILPLARGQAVARSDGEILDIFVSEGDVVKQGQTVAQLSSWNQQREVSVNESLLDGAKANLARLEAGPKVEEIDLARRKLESAEAKTAFSKAEAERNKELVATGTVSKQTYEKTMTAYQTDLAELEVSRANLSLVQSGATEEEIQIARSEVDRLTEELNYRRGELERTRIDAPMDGRVVTPNLELRHGSFLRVGETLLEIETSDKVNAVIAVPESDIGLIEVGNIVRLKAWGSSEDEIPGVVETVAQAAQDEGYGSVVRVGATFPNGDGIVRSGMTGYAKIEAKEMRVWEAYLRRIVRFFQIEVWSWIP